MGDITQIMIAKMQNLDATWEQGSFINCGSKLL